MLLLSVCSRKVVGFVMIMKVSSRNVSSRFSLDSWCMFLLRLVVVDMFVRIMIIVMSLMWNRLLFVFYLVIVCRFVFSCIML